MHSLAGRSDRRTFRDWAAVADVCGFCRSVRSTVSRDALSRVERPAELFMARGAAGGQYPGVLVLGFLLFCQSGNEASISGWTTTYVGAAGMGARTATLILAGYWAALMAGRLAVDGLLKVVGKLQLVLASGVGALIGAVILLTNRSEAMLVAGVLVIGLSYAGVFPTALAIAGDTYRKMAGTVFGLLFAIALVGGMSFPWAV